MASPMIQPDADGQLQVKLPAFVDDPEAYLREDTQILRQHLARMDAQAYGMLIWRALQMDIFTQVQLNNPEDGLYPGLSVEIAFEPHDSCAKHIAECVAQGLAGNLNGLQNDAMADFIVHLKSAGPITRARADEVIGGAYNKAFVGERSQTPSWQQARALQESVRIQEHTASIQDDAAQPRVGRTGRRI